MIIVRLVLTAILLVPVYFETGPWTVVVLALVALSFEAVNFVLFRLLDALRAFNPTGGRRG